MKFGTILLSIFFAACALAGTVWLGYRPPLPVTQSGTQVAESDDLAESDEPVEPPTPKAEPAPPISPTPPYPKAVVEPREFEFGVMEVGEERKHVFTIKNEGEAPLLLSRGDTTCKCTFSELASKEVPPGGSVEVELSWKPVSLEQHFSQRAVIQTNDPENKQIPLTVQGSVQQVVVMNPADSWEVGDISDTVPTEVAGVLYSAIVEEFNVVGIESSNPLLTAEAVPMPADRLKGLNAKTGYTIQVLLKPGLPVGMVREKLTIKTDVRDGTNFTVNVHGRRPGPLRFMAMPGTRWFGDVMSLNLGRFESTEGNKGTLSLFVTGLADRELEFLEIDADPDYLKLTLEPDPKFQVEGQKRYYLHVEVPPGSPPATLVRDTAGKIKIKTNHPEAETLEMSVQFISL